MVSMFFIRKSVSRWALRRAPTVVPDSAHAFVALVAVACLLTAFWLRFETSLRSLGVEDPEIALNNSPDETFVCNLGSVNLAEVDPLHEPNRLRRVVTSAMRMLDNVIDINFYPTLEARIYRASFLEPS